MPRLNIVDELFASPWMPSQIWCSIIRKFRTNSRRITNMQTLHEPESADISSLISKDADERTEVKHPSATMKHKPIHKLKNKVPQKKKVTPAEEESQPTVKPITPHNSESENYDILTDYFSNKIQDFYKRAITPEQRLLLVKIAQQSASSFSEIFGDNLGGVWQDKAITLSQIISYLELTQNLKECEYKFSIFLDQSNKQLYCCLHFQNGRKIIQISQLQKDLITLRQPFAQHFQRAKASFSGTPRMSQLSIQITFLAKILHQSTTELQHSAELLLNSIDSSMDIQGQDIYGEAEQLSNLYTRSIIIKMMEDALSDNPIDYLNFFRQNQEKQHPKQTNHKPITDRSEFEEFMRKKKNLKYIRNAKATLHSGCLGCMSSYYEPSNPFHFCIECGARFHESCSRGHNITEKNVVCEICYARKGQDGSNTPPKTRKKQCQLCGARGLLTVESEDGKHFHLFCLILNGLWKIQKKHIKYEPPSKAKKQQKQTCTICKVATPYTQKCQKCENRAHSSCAFLAGWKIDSHFNDNCNRPKIGMNCCMGGTKQNSRRRKFRINYRREAFKKEYAA